MPVETKRRPPHGTIKQITILKALVKRRPDGGHLDVYDLMDAAGSGRGAMICSLRHMAAHDLIEEAELVTRRGRRVRTYQATKTGADMVRPSGLHAGGSVKVGTP